ncbi:MAG: hypothetical protein ACK4KV_09605 [Rhodocyclaceae bacterium]
MPVKLLKPHRHAGRKYPVGAILEQLRTDQEDWLVGLGVAERAAPAAPGAHVAKPTAKAKE